MRTLSFATLLATFIAHTAVAGDNWVTVSKPNPPLGPLMVNAGRVLVNEYGNRVATVRSRVQDYQLDSLTEFNCNQRRVRTLASALTDKQGQLVTAKGLQDRWFTEAEGAVGITEICAASLQLK